MVNQSKIHICSHLLLMNYLQAAVLLSLLAFIEASQIVSRPIRSAFKQWGQVQLVVEWKPTVEVCSSCLLQVSFPESIHANSTPLTYLLQDESGITYIDSSSSLPPTSALYYFPINQPLSPNIWYILTIYPTQPPTLVYGLVGVRVVAGTGASSIVYSSNSAFEYYHCEPITVPPPNVVLAAASSASSQASQVFPFQLNITSTVGYSDDTLITVLFTSQTYSSLNSTVGIVQNNNFNFVGSCQVACSNVSCINPVYCGIKNNQIQLLLPQLPAAVIYTLQFTVLNPAFVDSTGLAAQISTTNTQISGLAILDSLFSVSPITILAGGVNLHWGIPLDIVQADMGLGIFVDGGWNTIDIGFTISEPTMIGVQFAVSVYVGATSVLEQSINTNLPSLKGTSDMRCTYAMPYMECSPVDAFTSIATRYSIKFKAYFASADNIASLGSVSISICSSNNKLFNDMTQNLSITKIQWSDYHDYSGFHSSAYNIKETQVIGVPDTGLANSTSAFMNTLYSSNSSFVGIDPEAGTQQLVFLLKTLPSQMSLGLPNETYQMKVFINPRIFSSIATQGIDVAAFHQPSASYRQDAVSCYINSSTSPTIQIYQCQVYNDYVYGRQIDNTYSNMGLYGVYSFTCGSGQAVVCPANQSCAQSCRILKGKGNSSGDSGVFSIRKASFVAGYQSPLLADDNTLDFMIAFYNGATLVSASLINAYTVKQARLSFLNATFINTYLSSTKTNDGARIPHLLCLSGHLSLQEINRTKYDQFWLFLPQQVSVNKYIELTGRVGCSHSCRANRFYNGVGLCEDNWICKQRVSIKGLTNLDSSIDFKIPIQVATAISGSFDLVFLSSNTITKVYRISGSAITDPMAPTSSPFIPVTTYSNPWIDTNYWVVNASDVYKQGLNLNSLVQFSSSNSIDMQGSSLTYAGSGSFTFTSIQSSIFSPFTSVLSNNAVQCNSPFYYTYNSLYNLTVLWCPLIAGLNQLTINYPFYSSAWGANFPFQTIFAYGFSDGSGNLIAYRTQSNSKTAKDICTTAHLQTFNYGDILQQIASFSISLNAVTLSAASYPSLQIRFGIPTQIPVSFVRCTALQTLGNHNIDCSIVSSVSNNGTIQLSSPNPLTIMSLQVDLWMSVTGPVTPPLSYLYNILIQLPQTDASSNAAIYGQAYSPYWSDLAGCSSTMNLVNSSALNQVIQIDSVRVSGVALGYLSDISFNIKFSATRANILSTSQIWIVFTNAVTSSGSTCVWTPQTYLFVQQVASGSVVKLKPLAYDTPFSYKTYSILCKNIVVNQNTVSVSAQWVDGPNILQKSLPFPCTLNLSAATSVSASLLAKNYNSLGYDSTFTFSISIPTNPNDNLDIWVDVSPHQLHVMVLECYDVSANRQIYCINDWEGKVHVKFTAVSSSSSMVFSIYGIVQSTVSAGGSYQILAGINNSVYYSSAASDSLAPNAVSAPPILIKGYYFQPGDCVLMTVTFPVNFSATFYIRLDDTFMVLLPAQLSCSIDNSTQTCVRVAPNLILLTLSFTLSPNTDYNLSIWNLPPTKLDLLDPHQIHFKVFTLTGNALNIASYQTLLYPYQLSSLPVSQTSLIWWSFTNFNTSWLYHQIYVGYYKDPIFLSTFNSIVFSQNISLSFTSFNSYSYMNTTNDILLGLSNCQIELACMGTVGNTIDYVEFNHSSQLYEQPPLLALFVSSEKCSVQTLYSLYETYPGGITLPIVLDFSNCRPAATHQLVFAINSTELAIDTSLSNQKVNSTFPQAYIFIRQMPTNPHLSGVFALQIELSGPFSSSFAVTPAVNVRVNAGSILQIPQSQPPDIAYQDSCSVNLTLQCNQPSTIYWALGLYPTILAITYEAIQSCLISGQEGVRSRVYDPYSWSREIYGIDYEYYSNKNKTIGVGGLFGNSNYIFKYFCVNELGFASGGQIANFTTGATAYELTKVQLKMDRLLSINQANQIACYIAEVLLTAYSTVTTSTFSNCVNTSATFYSSPNTTYFDQKAATYAYFFYVDSQTIPTADILSTLPIKLPTYTPYLNTIPPYSSISITPLANSYDPLMLNATFSPMADMIGCSFKVGVVPSYVVLAYMSQVFDPLTMGVPPHHLIKQGNFSASSRFNQVYMKYGTNNITINITNLDQNSNYSLFYFVTVDNPALNSKPTTVYYQNIITSQYAIYDLFSLQPHLLALLLLSFLIL